jgi:hypothetical protein
MAKVWLYAGILLLVLTASILVIDDNSIIDNHKINSQDINTREVPNNIFFLNQEPNRKQIAQEVFNLKNGGLE